MVYTSTVTPKGLVLIPVDVRLRYGLKPSTAVVVEETLFRQRIGESN